MRNINEERIRSQVNRLGRPDIPVLDGEIARQERSGMRKKAAGVAMSILIAVAAAVILITNVLITVLQIDGSSMNPLLNMDEIVCAVRGNNPGRNDIIAFYQNNKIHIKRVIATAGDTVDIEENGVVWVNGLILDEPYVSKLALGHCDVEMPLTVPPGSVFVLGDNRPQSVDSRDSRFGPVEREQIIGRVFMSLWPLNRAGGLRPAELGR